MSDAFEAIVVLANLMSATGELNDESKGRADAALEAFNAGLANLIVPCGWSYRTDSPTTIAEAIACYLRGRGVGARSLVLEDRSRDTVGDAVFTKLRLQHRRILVVTSDYHAARALAIFRFVYGPDRLVEVTASPTPPAPDKVRGESASLAAFHATFHGVRAGDDGAILERLLARHPFYNGEVHPAFESEGLRTNSDSPKQN